MFMTNKKEINVKDKSKMQTNDTTSSRERQMVQVEMMLLLMLILRLCIKMHTLFWGFFNVKTAYAVRIEMHLVDSSHVSINHKVDFKRTLKLVKKGNAN